ncbi:hypothetical protein [Streptomyces sp. NBC_00198]|uniref:hypothetical protein n=1 Tax=Streptomyces sp. NBC_00198 TaxID=2975677 RepID=UPI0022559D46|nr:hypothetical protein [Streptomyces sp. NBC_00198]MCX5285674.1 hypothetical protein [Streptomyces sp. NBC_00198]MCX5286224.1 hypothetical protein [Streptomyces sp. NBC_00198]
MSQGPNPPDHAVASVFWPPPVPTIGQIVLYRLDAADVRAICRRRLGVPTREPAVRAGDLLPAIIVRVNGDDADASCNLHVFLDGYVTHWARDVHRGDEDGTWAWPVRAGG